MSNLETVPHGWNLESLEDICNLQAGKFIPAHEIQETYHEGLYPCYGGNGIRGYVSKFSHDGVFPLIGRQGALCGNVNKASCLFYATEHAVVATPRENVYANWLYYQLVQLDMNKYATGVAQPGLSVKNIEQIKVYRPPINEQKSIASLLGKWDTAIEKTEALIAAKEQQFKWLLKTLISDQQDNPEWQKVKLGDVGEIITGNTPSKKDSNNYNGSYCWATAEDFNNRYIIDTTIKLTEKGKKLARFVPTGSVLVTCIGSIGLNAIAKVSLSTNQQINSIVPYPEYDSDFIYYLIQNGKNKLKSFAGSGGILMLNKNEFSKIEFLLPQLYKQKHIAKILNTAQKKIDLLKQLTEQYRIQKRGLMQKLLTGKWRVESREELSI